MTEVRGAVGRPRTWPDAVAIDKTHSRANRAHLRKQSIEAVIRQKADQAANHKKAGHRGGRPAFHGAELHKDRNSAERCINKIKAWRCFKTRSTRLPTATSSVFTCAEQ
ncbi:hypothetical protein ACWC9U_27135 [Streptomyces sp. 900116325]